MKLYIAEKPSLGRAIADVLPKPHKKEDGFIRAANGDCVSWCIGHLLEQAEPEAYDAAFKKWQFEHLPIIPDKWQLKPKTKTRKQLTVLKKLLKQADDVVHAGDPDREGQLLVDQVIAYIGLTEQKKSQVQRVLISDLNPAAVKRALAQPKSNKLFVPLSTSALARSRADWLYGINMTRAYTLQGQKAGYRGVLSVGRVQTPILGLVVRRDREINDFVSKPFYEVLAHLATEQGEQFTAKWQPSEACQPHQDEDGRVLSRKLAEHVVNKINGKPGEITSVERKKKSQAPPLPYNLSQLQIDAAKRFGLSAQQVLDTCQSLYEKHKLITYPRSDCRYLPKDHYAQRESVLGAISHNCQALQTGVQQADSQLRSKAWNDSKVDAHHAIIPTQKHSKANLSPAESHVYELIARQYLCQFYPKHTFNEMVIQVTIEGGLFVAKAKQVTAQGWKALFPRKRAAAGSGETDDDTELPAVQQGQAVYCHKGELVEKMTQPPAPFTDATLLAAMTGISRYVSDPEIKKILKETDGLGTEATRAGILELLFKRGFLQRQGKQIRASETGCALIDSLPQSASTPDMTAHWESVLDQISQRQASYHTLMTPLTDQLDQLIAQSCQVTPQALKGLSAPQGARGRSRRKGQKGRRNKSPSAKQNG